MSGTGVGRSGVVSVSVSGTTISPQRNPYFGYSSSSHVFCQSMTDTVTVCGESLKLRTETAMKSVFAFRNIGPDVTVTFPLFPLDGGKLKIGLTVMTGLNVLLFVLVGLFSISTFGQQHGFD